MRRSVTALMLAAAAVLATACSTPPPAADRDPAVLGASVATRSGMSYQESVTLMEQQIGRTLAAVRVYKLWNDPFPTADDLWLAGGGRTLVLSVKPDADGVPITWRDIATAVPGSELDRRMHAWARAFRDFGAPVYVAFHHEPEARDRIAHGSATDYVAAYRHWVDVLREAGADNVRPMWIMTGQSFAGATDGSPDETAAQAWYPGDDYVDAIASDAYNWLDCRPFGPDVSWQPLENQLLQLAAYGTAHPDEELWLGEFGSVEEPGDPTRKGDWMRSAGASLNDPRLSRIAGMLYFNSGSRIPGQGCHWWIDTSEQSLEGFREMAGMPVLDGRVM